MDTATQRKWDVASRNFDLLSYGDERRLAPHKRRLFAKMEGKILMLAAGTGNDFRFFPSGRSIIALDISAKMLERAAKKAALYDGRIELRQMDVCELDFPDDSFDTVLTVHTFCSVSRPVAGLRELYRVLRPRGQILMLEHVRSRIGPIGVFLDLMTPLSTLVGPALNRDTVANVQKAGFRIRREENVYLDIVKIIEGVKNPTASSRGVSFSSTPFSVMPTDGEGGSCGRSFASTDYTTSRWLLTCTSSARQTDTCSEWHNESPRRPCMPV